MSTLLIGDHALLASELLQPHVKLYNRAGGSAEPITLEEAKQVARAGSKLSIVTPVSEMLVVALMQRLADYKAAVDNVDIVSQELEDKILSERAQFVRTAAMHFMSGLDLYSNLDERVGKAIEYAEVLDRALWARVDASKLP